MLFLTEGMSRKRNNEDLLEDLFDWELWKPMKRLRCVRWPTQEEQLMKLSPILPLLSKEFKKNPQKKLEPKKCEEIERFSLTLDVSHFKPEDIEIKVVDKKLIICGKHEERKDGVNGFVSRQFTRRYELPENYDSDLIMSWLTSDGKLTIEAPLKKIEKMVPITIENNQNSKLTTTITRADEEEESVEKERNRTESN